MVFKPPLTCEEAEASLGSLFENMVSLPCGGQGAVFKCIHRESKEIVALKIYYTNQVHQRAHREIELMKRIAGDTLVKLVESGETLIRGSKCIFIATKFIKGDVLSRIVEEGEVEISIVAKCGCDIAKAIQLLWAERIVHRDINPKNIMLSSEGLAVLIDLGIARHIDLKTLTAPGCSWGTLGYLSPEQARATKQLSFKSDVFALGITLQECLAGSHPVNHRQDMLHMGGCVFTSTIRDDIPKTMATLIDRMLKYRAYERPQLNEICNVLEAYV